MSTIRMKEIPLYKFYKRKYGRELLIDVLDLDYIKDGIKRTPIHRESFYQIVLFTQGHEEVVIDGCRRMIHPGEVACSRPGEVWTWNADTRLEGYVIIFTEIPYLCNRIGAAFVCDSVFMYFCKVNIVYC